MVRTRLISGPAKRYCVSVGYPDLKAAFVSESHQVQSEPGFLVCSSKCVAMVWVRVWGE